MKSTIKLIIAIICYVIAAVYQIIKFTSKPTVFTDGPLARQLYYVICYNTDKISIIMFVIGTLFLAWYVFGKKNKKGDKD